MYDYLINVALNLGPNLGYVIVIYALYKYVAYNLHKERKILNDEQLETFKFWGNRVMLLAFLVAVFFSVAQASITYKNVTYDKVNVSRQLNQVSSVRSEFKVEDRTRQSTQTDAERKEHFDSLVKYK